MLHILENTGIFSLEIGLEYSGICDANYFSVCVIIL